MIPFLGGDGTAIQFGIKYRLIIMGFSTSDTMLDLWLFSFTLLESRGYTPLKHVKYNLETQVINLLSLCASKVSDNSYISSCDMCQILDLALGTHCALLLSYVSISIFPALCPHPKLQAIILFKPKVFSRFLSIPLLTQN